MTLRRSIIFILFYLISVIYSCTKKETESFQQGYLNVHDIDLENYQFIGSDLDERIILKEGDTTEWDNYLLHLNFLSTTYYSSQQNSYSGDLYALSPPPICCDPVGLDTLYIVSLNNYNSIYLSGDTLNDIISIHQRYAESKSDLIPISVHDYISINQEQLFSLEEIDILINDPPSDSISIQKFKVIFKMNDNRVFISNSSEVSLLL